MNCLNLEYYFNTDTGKVRLSNQDNLTILKNDFNEIMMVVADGMGGHNSGDYASKLCIDFISKKFYSRKKPFKSLFLAKIWLRYLINKCNSFIFNIGEQSKLYKGMGTTVVIAFILLNHIISLNVGDSRLYLIKNNKISLFSEDQSYVNLLVNQGQISKEEAKKRDDNNVLTASIGSQPTTNQNLKSKKYEDETILLCSDGLFHVLNDEEILKFFNSSKSLENICNEMIEEVNKNGGPDNVSIAILRRMK